MSGLPTERKGNWMQTYTGRKFWPLDPRPEEVYIQDIAHSLSHQCRYAGHCMWFYSVAEHCVLLSQNVAPEHALWALLHDASEAYLVDIPRPVKPYLSEYREIEAKVMAAVCHKFNLSVVMPDEVNEVDGRILNDECQQNMSIPPEKWADTGKPLGVELQFWMPTDAKRQFLDRFLELTK